MSQRGGGLKDVESMALPHEKGVEVRLGPGDLKRRFWLVVSNIF